MSTPAELLTQAQAAYHALLMGQSPRVICDQNNERVEFTAANSDKLKAYIDSLALQVAGSTPARGPLNVYF